jgi:photosystem II stability/assembly factor-like uncharacterized protein
LRASREVAQEFKMSESRTGRWVALAAGAMVGAMLGATHVPSAQAPAFDPASFAALRWRQIGPMRGGRSIAVAAPVSRPNEAYFGAVGGGLWKTTDGGTTWTPVTDGQIKSSSVGAVAVSESNPDVVYIGMGESCIRGNIMQGDGIYKSTDAGKTWTNVGFNKWSGQTISRIRIHPANPDIAFAAVFGNITSPDEERGVFRTKDGGKTWERVLFRDARTAAVDLVLDRNNPNVIYASLWEAYRLSWQMSSGGPGSGLFKSTDGGDTWTELTRRPGMPSGMVGRIGVAVSGADSNRVFALVENENGGLFISDDAGGTWKLSSDDRRFRQRAFYYSHVYADPKAKDTVYLLNVNFLKSTDAGKTLQQLRPPHGDHHDLWIDPNNPQHLVSANDGGGTVSVNGGETWTGQAFPTAQLYRLSTTNDSPFHACGGQQDNTTVCVPASSTPGTLGVHMYSAGGGESGYVTPHPTNTNLFYSGSQGALITRFDRNTGHIRDIQPYPRFFSGEPASSLPERWQWTFPIVFSPFDPKTLYISSQHVWRTTNDGQTWERISPDLTKADPKTLGHSGGPITGDMNGPEIFGTVFALAPSARERGLIWAGSDDGLVQVTRDDGKNWTNVTPPDAPSFGRVSTIDPSPHQAGTAFVAIKAYLVPPGDRAPYIFRTEDYGKTWTKIVSGIASGHYVHSVREDLKRPGLLYAGTEHGVYVSFDNGGNWTAFNQNLPDTQISDIVAEENDVVIATHGRSMWVMDNVAPLRQMKPEVLSSALFLFAPKEATRSAERAAIDYFLKPQTDKVTVEILDRSGSVIRTFARTAEEDKKAEEERKKRRAEDTDDDDFGPPRQQPPTLRAGLNRFSWDMRYPGATVFPGMVIWSARPENGPVAVPGQYQVRVTANGVTQTQPLVIRRNPEYTNVSDADLQKQFDLAIQIRDRTSEANQAIVDIRQLKTQIKERLDKSKNTRLKEAGELLVKRLGGVEEEIYQVRNQSNQDPLNFPIKINNRLAALRRSVENGDNPPTDASYQVFKELSAELQKQLDALAAIEKGDLANFNKALGSQKLAPVGVKKPGA